LFSAPSSAIDVNSNASVALAASGNGTVSATSIGVVGGYSVSGNAKLSPTPKSISPVSDPFAAVPTPSLTGPMQPAVNISSTTTKTINPGTYPSLTASSKAVLTLQPGVYVVTQSVSISGTAKITGSGVTIYLACGTTSAAQACATGQPGATLTVSGTAIFTLSAPTTGTYGGLTIFADRNNTSTVSLSGNASDSLSGGIYAKTGALSLSGNGGVTQLNALIVVGTAAISGNGSITLNAPPAHASSASSSYAATTASSPLALTATGSSVEATSPEVTASWGSGPWAFEVVESLED
jgi:hypothetical protein